MLYSVLVSRAGPGTDLATPPFSLPAACRASMIGRLHVELRAARELEDHIKEHTLSMYLC